MSSDAAPSQVLSQDTWRDLIKIVRDTIPNLDPQEELGDLNKAEAAFRSVDSQREKIITGLEHDVRQLTKQHAAAVSAAQRPATHPTPAAHAANVRSLEQKQAEGSRQLGEEQATVTQKQADVEKLRVEKEEIGTESVGEDDWVDGKAIRLSLMNKIGFTLIPGQESEVTSKILIRNDAKDDVHTVTVDDKRSKVYYANTIWSLAGE